MRDVAPLIKRKDEGNSGDNQGQSMGSNALNGIMEFMSVVRQETHLQHILNYQKLLQE